MSNPFLIRSPLGGDYEIYSSVPQNISYCYLPRAVPYFIQGEWGHIIFQQLSLDNVDFWDSQYMLNTAVMLEGASNVPFIELYNAVSNHFVSSLESIDLLNHRQGQGGFCAGPYINSSVQFPGKGNYRTSDFHFKPEYLIPFASAYPKLDRAMNNFEKGGFAQIDGKVLHAGIVGVALEQMINPCVREAMLDIYYQNKASEYALLALECLDPVLAEPMERGSSRDMADSIAEFIHQHYNRAISLEEIARAHYVTIPTMQRIFKKRYKVPVHQYIMHTRIREVKRLLLETSDDLESISLVTMFSGAQHLCNIFKRITGQTPNQFRQSKRK
jgi:AraC-like DNA-binding protein